MTYYITGSTFSLQTDTHLPRILYSNNGIISGRSNGVIVPTDKINGLSSTTSVYMKLAPLDITAERLGDNECYALLSNISTISPPASAPFYVGIASYDTGYVATTRYKTFPLPPLFPEISIVQFYTSQSQYSANVEGLIIDNVDCSSNGTTIVGTCNKDFLEEVLYYSTNSGLSYNVTPLAVVAGSNIFIKMTRAGDYFTVSNSTNNILYFYKTSNMSKSNYPINVSCLSMNSDGTLQYVFDNTGYVRRLTVDTSLIGSGNPVTNSVPTTLSAYTQDGYPVKWNSCASALTALNQMAVGFVNNTDCYIYTTINGWGLAETITKLSGIYSTKSVSFMSSDGSKKWCIINGQLYKFIITSQKFEPQIISFNITNGTCNSSGNTVYLTDDNGNIWSSINDAPFTKQT